MVFVLSGGSTPKTRLPGNCRPKRADRLETTYIFFGDERCVPPDHPDSNYRMAKKTFLDKVRNPTAKYIPYDCGEIAPGYRCPGLSRDDRRPFLSKLKSDSIPFSWDSVMTAIPPLSSPAGRPAEENHLGGPQPQPPYPDRPAHPHISGDQCIPKSIIFLVTGENKADIVADVIHNPAAPTGVSCKTRHWH